LVVLRDGRVQQVGTPEELHKNPVNWHVADFMGYRNLIDLKVSAVDGSAVRLEGQGLVLNGTAVEPAAVGDQVRVAIRPEDLLVASPAQPAHSGNSVAAKVAVVEYHGREFAVGVTTEQGQVLHVHSDHSPAIGGTVELTADPSRVLAYPLELSDSGRASQEERDLDEVRG